MKEKSNTKKNVRASMVTLYHAIVSLALSFFVIVLAVAVGLRSFGWFASNKTVEGKGMAVGVQPPPNLVISDDPDDFSGSDLSLLFKKVFDKPAYFTTDVAELEPATHKNMNGVEKLVVVSNEENINPFTGLAKEQSTLEFNKDAVENVNYVEFVSYVGVHGASMEYQNLTLRLNPEKCYAKCLPNSKAKSGVTYYARDGVSFEEVTLQVNADAENYYTRVFDGIYRTVSIDVLYNDVYKATLRASDADPQTVLSASGTLKVGEPGKVTLRIFFDGMMRESEGGKAILRAENQIANGIYLGFEFTVEDNE